MLYCKYKICLLRTYYILLIFIKSNKQNKLHTYVFAKKIQKKYFWNVFNRKCSVLAAKSEPSLCYDLEQSHSLTESLDIIIFLGFLFGWNVLKIIKSNLFLLPFLCCLLINKTQQGKTIDMAWMTVSIECYTCRVIPFLLDESLMYLGLFDWVSFTQTLSSVRLDTGCWLLVLSKVHKVLTRFLQLFI